MLMEDEQLPGTHSITQIAERDTTLPGLRSQSGMSRTTTAGISRELAALAGKSS